MPVSEPATENRFWREWKKSSALRINCNFAPNFRYLIFETLMALQFNIIFFFVLYLCSKFIEWNEKKVLFRRKKLYYSLCRIVTSAQADFLLRLARMLGGTQKVWSEPAKKKVSNFFSMSMYARRKHCKAYKSFSRQIGVRVRGPETQAHTHPYTHTGNICLRRCEDANFPCLRSIDTRLRNLWVVRKLCEFIRISHGPLNYVNVRVCVCEFVEPPQSHTEKHHRNQ